MAWARRGLQIAVAIGGLVPVSAGLQGILSGPWMSDGQMPVSLDSHWRYLSGLLLGIGLAFWSTIPRIESQGERFRLLTILVFIGGLGRLASFVLVGNPGGMLVGLAMELAVTPCLCLWQTRIASSRR